MILPSFLLLGSSEKKCLEITQFKEFKKKVDKLINEVDYQDPTLFLGSKKEPFTFTNNDEINYFFISVENSVIKELEFSFLVMSENLWKDFFKRCDDLTNIVCLEWIDISPFQLDDLMKYAPSFVKKLIGVNFSSSGSEEALSSLMQKFIQNSNLIYLELERRSVKDEDLKSFLEANKRGFVQLRLSYNNLTKKCYPHLIKYREKLEVLELSNNVLDEQFYFNPELKSFWTHCVKVEESPVFTFSCMPELLHSSFTIEMCFAKINEMAHFIEVDFTSCKINKKTIFTILELLKDARFVFSVVFDAKTVVEFYDLFMAEKSFAPYVRELIIMGSRGESEKQKILSVAQHYTENKKRYGLVLESLSLKASELNGLLKKNFWSLSLLANLIEDDFTQVFEGYEALEELDLSFNYLTKITPLVTLLGKSKIKYLNVTENEVSEEEFLLFMDTLLAIAPPWEGALVHCVPQTNITYSQETLDKWDLVSKQLNFNTNGKK